MRWSAYVQPCQNPLSQFLSLRCFHYQENPSDNQKKSRTPVFTLVTCVTVGHVSTFILFSHILISCKHRWYRFSLLIYKNRKIGHQKSAIICYHFASQHPQHSQHCCHHYCNPQLVFGSIISYHHSPTTIIEFLSSIPLSPFFLGSIIHDNPLESTIIPYNNHQPFTIIPSFCTTSPWSSRFATRFATRFSVHWALATSLDTWRWKWHAGFLDLNHFMEDIRWVCIYVYMYRYVIFIYVFTLRCG